MLYFNLKQSNCQIKKAQSGAFIYFTAGGVCPGGGVGLLPSCGGPLCSPFGPLGPSGLLNPLDSMHYLNA